MNFKFLAVIALVFAFNLVNAQEEKEAIAKLSFLVGEWEGISTIYSEDSVKKGKVTKKVKYLLNGNLLSVEVKSPYIHLHTVIGYNVKDSTYYYHPFNKAGKGNAYKGEFENGKFVVTFNDNYKIFFEKTEEGKFHEYGVRVIGGKEEITFEDLLEPLTSKSQQKMKDLSFLIGEWVGTYTYYEDGKITEQAPSFNRARYDVKKNIIIIDSNSKTSRIHTVIYYDEKEETFYYQYFTSDANRKLPAELKNEQLVISANEKLRFIIGKIDDWHGEVAERFEDGKWVRIYEDRVVNTN